MAQMNPPNNPTIISPDTEPKSRDCRNRCHVHAAVAKAHTSRMPVLFTVPFSVIRLVASIAPPYCAPGRLRNVFSLSAGFDVFINAIAYSPWCNYVSVDGAGKLHLKLQSL